MFQYNIIQANAVCQDSDSGKDYDKKGKVSVSGSGSSGTYYDICFNSGKILHEWYCQGDQVQKDEYECPIDCVDGACVDKVSTTETVNETIDPDELPGNTCIDSDGGLEYYTKGTAETRGQNSAGRYYDLCFNSGKVLHEWYCKNGKQIAKMEYECPKDCVDGACVGKPKEENSIIQFIRNIIDRILKIF